MGKPVEKTIHQLAGDGAAEEVQKLLNQGADVNAINDRRRTPLSIACSLGKSEIIQVLLENDANTEILSPSPFTDLPPIFRAIDRQSVGCVRLLLERGAKVQDVGVDFPIPHAVKRGADEIIKLLAKYGADIDALHYPRTSSLVVAANQHYPTTFQLLLDLGADVNILPRYFESIKSEHYALELVKAGFTRLNDEELREHWEKKWPRSSSLSDLEEAICLRDISALPAFIETSE